MKIVACGLQAPAKFVYMYKHLLFSYICNHLLLCTIDRQEEDDVGNEIEAGETDGGAATGANRRRNHSLAQVTVRQHVSAVM